MPQTYRFQVSVPAVDLLPRNRFVNVLHFQHSLGGLAQTDLRGFAVDLAELYLSKYERVAEVQVKSYEIGPPPQYPLDTYVTHPGSVWGLSHPPEQALCLSYAGENRGNRSERGRMYLAPSLHGATPLIVDSLRPNANAMAWALSWYEASNASLPDLGGPDWQFGIYSRKLARFTTAQQAWVDDEWDVQRRRGLRESTRITAVRQG